MAVKGNDSNTKVINERVVYVGPALVSVVFCNPTLAELTASGSKIDKEPEYLSDAEDGTKKVRIDFCVQNVDGFKSKVSFFLENKERVTKAGDKFEFINNQGQNTWCASVEEAIAKVGKNGNTYFKPEGARKALVGEVDFYNFIKNWANVAPDEDCSLENIQNLFKGNFKEPQSIVKMMAANTVWVMATVNDKNYQNINNKCFGRATSKQFPKTFADYAKKQAEVENGKYAIKDVYAFEFKEYVAKPVFADPEPGSIVGETTTEVDF